MEKSKLTEFERVKKQIAIFNEIGKTLTSSLTVNEVLEKILYKVAEFFSPENWSLLLVDEASQELYFEIVVGDFQHTEKLKDIRLKIGEGVAGWVAKTGRPLFVPSVDEEPKFSKKVDKATKFSTESIICIPLKIRDKVLGVIELINKKDITPLQKYDMEILATVADYAAIALENARNYEEVHRLTISDDISGLFNARHLHTLLELEVERAKFDGTPFSIIFLDLDSFKKVNDTYGHLIGSRLLGEIGLLLSECMKDSYCAARYGGDEFVIILPATPKDEALSFCRELRDVLREKSFFEDEGISVRVTASFGIAAYPEDAQTKDELLHAADERMYRVKDRQKDDIEA